MTTSQVPTFTVRDTPQDAARPDWMCPTWPKAMLLALMLLAAFLNFVNMDAIGDANTYYTAAVEAMLQSPSNFFFVAAEPGGSVTIDKPPLGLWLQAISAFFLGVNGFAVVLPQILAGIFSVPVLYHLVKRYFGTAAGLIAALVMAIMPVSVAVQRNNTMDATLIFTLLLAAWAFIHATETGKLKWLLLGGVLVGLGFNIKMLQAFLPLPAFYALYFLGARTGWLRKIWHLAVTTVLMLVVSLSWIIVVDLTPASMRPYVGSSSTNSALELAIGYNGLQRLLGHRVNVLQGDTDAAAAPAGGAPTGGRPGAGGGMFSNEVGTAGALRLFTQPLDNEIGWLLPLGLLSVVLLMVAARPQWPLPIAHKGLLLWGGWLLTEVVFFSVAGFFHAYYLAMVTPPLAALVGIGLARLWEAYPHRKLWITAALGALGGAIIAYQGTIAAGYSENLRWLAVPAGLLLAGLVILGIPRFVARLSRFAVVGFVLVVLSLTTVPTVWAGMTSLGDAQSGLPSAYGGNGRDQRGGGQPPAGMPNSDDGAGMRPPAGALGDDGAADGGQPPFTIPDDAPGGTTGMDTPLNGGFPGAPNDGGARGGAGAPGGGGGVNEELLAYLQSNTAGMRWMMAVSSSSEGADYVLETGRGVMYMGGFNGSDPVVDAESLQDYIEAGDLRYILSGGRGGRDRGGSSDITAWLAESCSAVTDVTVNGTLYDCTVS